MPSLKDVKMNRSEVRKTKRITKAMNMYLASAAARRQSRITSVSRPYAEKFQAVLGDLFGQVRRLGSCDFLSAVPVPGIS